MIRIKYDGTTRNIRKPGAVGDFNFCTFNKNCNGLTSWSFEIPASAYCHPLATILTSTLYPTRQDKIRPKANFINSQILRNSWKIMN